jgi:hypothetical protein
MLLKAPFRLPPRFMADFGYTGRRRFVALFWEPCGDEACYDDGESFACGLCDNGLFLGFIYQRPVAGWLDENGVHLGDSEREARHWLVSDTQTGDLYAAPRGEASFVVRTQRLPPPTGAA